MKRFQNIVLLVLIALAGNAFGQESGWELDYLQGKVKIRTEYHYEFDISDSINHDEFMRRFYQCGFDADRMIRFADSINSKQNLYSCSMHEYDSLGSFTRISYHSSSDNMIIDFQNEYDENGRISKKVRIDEIVKDSAFYKYDAVGRLSETRHWNHFSGYRTTQWIYDSEGRLLEENRIEGDSVQSYFRKSYDKKGVLHKSERFGFPNSNTKIYCEYDSRGNVIYERRENCGLAHVIETRTKYKYDRNDSIIKETSRETRRWHTVINSDDDRWQETDSTGQVVDYVNYKVTVIPNNKKEKLKHERIIKRNAEGFPVKEKYVQKDKYGKMVSYSEYDGFGRVVKIEDFYNDDTIPREVKKYKYDGLGRLIERERIDNRRAQFHKQIWRYYKDTDFYSYYATYGGENYDFSHESLFFFDDQGNCIAHIQWMPKTQNSEYYYNVFKIEYYE